MFRCFVCHRRIVFLHYPVVAHCVYVPPFFACPYFSLSRSLPLLCVATIEELPDSIRRVGLGEPFPNEFPGNDYSFNWTLNRDGVTPLKELAFQISKPLDLRIAGLEPLTTKPNVSYTGNRNYEKDADIVKSTSQPTDELNKSRSCSALFWYWGLY